MVIKYEIDGRELSEEEINDLKVDVFETDYYEDDDIVAPSSEMVKRTRMGLVLSQLEASKLARVSLQTWQKYELKNSKSSNPIPLPVWELFLLKTKLAKLPK
jgi:phosphorylcholine metabolism protein LicD